MTTKDTATPALIALQKKLENQALHPVAGIAGVNVVRRHLLERNRSKPNKLGGRRTEFYRRAANATIYRSTGSDVQVVIAWTGIAYQYYGGTITAKKSKYLTIPARAQAHGKRAREFKDLHFQPIKKGKSGLLADSDGNVFFWLVKSVSKQADKSVLPPFATILQAVSKAISSHLSV